MGNFFTFTLTILSKQVNSFLYYNKLLQRLVIISLVAWLNEVWKSKLSCNAVLFMFIFLWNVKMNKSILNDLIFILSLYKFDEMFFLCKYIGSTCSCPIVIAKTRFCKCTSVQIVKCVHFMAIRVFRTCDYWSYLF